MLIFTNPIFSDPDSSDTHTPTDAGSALHPTAQPSQPLSPSSQTVYIWQPDGGCDGSFVSQIAEYDDEKLPYALIREAVIDRRVSTSRFFRKFRQGVDEHQAIPFVKFLVFMSIHVSVQLAKKDIAVVLHSAEFGSPSVRNEDAHMWTDLQVSVDEISQFDADYNEKIFRNFAPGMKTKARVSLAEWRVSFSIQPNSSAKIKTQEALENALLQEPSSLSFSFDMPRYDGQRVTFKAWMRMSCIMDWITPGVYPSISALNSDTKCTSNASDTEGAVLFSGSLLHGEKSHESSYFSEIAHFAARALTGPIQYDLVVMSVSPIHTISGVTAQCGSTDGACRRRLMAENRGHLESVRDSVILELQVQGVDLNLFEKLILVPGCRLGSDVGPAGSEQDACASSYMSGQHVATMFAYAMLSPYYKWAISHDMDEFLLWYSPDLNISSSAMKPVRADTVLDSMDVKNVGFMTIEWLVFKSSRAVMSNITADLLSGKPPTLKFINPSERGPDCRGKWNTGKPAVRCDIGLGFSVHQPVVDDVKEDQGLSIFSENTVEHLVSSYYVWHAKIYNSGSLCVYQHVKNY